MNRSPLTRRFATAVLVALMALFAVALVPLFFGLRSDDVVSKVTGVLALQTDAIVVDQPIRLSVSPDVSVTAGTLSLSANSVAGQKVATLKSTRIEVELGNWGLASGADPVRLVFAPLVEQLSGLMVDRVILERSTLVLKWGGARTALLEDINSEINIKGKSPVSASGAFTYLRHPFVFDASLGSSGTASPVDEAARGTRWPLMLNASSPVFGLVFDGAVDIGGDWSLKGQAEARTPDVGRLSAAMGHGAVIQEAGPAIRIRGPVRWADGVIDFGKSQISIGDQEGVGAVALALRHGRPSVEATAAFPALDVAPLLQRGSKSPTSSSLNVWRGLATSFPAIARFDAELRLSASRLQWNGAPIGRGAVSVTARDGRLHGDFAELDLGSLAGNLQFSIDGTAPGIPVSLRGKFESADIASTAAGLFGVSLLRGRAQSQIELTGYGPTLGDVVDRGTVAGTITMGEGQMPFDLNVAQRIAQSSQDSQPAKGWSTLSQLSAIDGCSIKFQMRDGTILIDPSEVRSRGLVAHMRGRIGMAGSDLDLWVRVAKEVAGRSQSARPLDPAARVPWRDSLSIRGAWAEPVIARGENEALLP
jgi:AsmA-like C-terminal region